MKIYTAATVILGKESSVNLFPILSTGFAYESIDDFLVFCEDSVMKRLTPEFTSVDIYINATEAVVLQDGTIYNLSDKTRYICR